MVGYEIGTGGIDLRLSLGLRLSLSEVGCGYGIWAWVTGPQPIFLHSLAPGELWS